MSLQVRDLEPFSRHNLVTAGLGFEFRPWVGVQLPLPINRPPQSSLRSRLSASPRLARQSPPPQIADMSGWSYRFSLGDRKDCSNKPTRPTVLLYEHTEDRQ